MDNIQLCYIDNEINKIDKMKQGDLLPTPVASDHTGSCTIRKMTKSNGAPRTDSLRNMPAVIGMDGAVAVTLSLAARRGGLPACGDRPSIL